MISHKFSGCVVQFTAISGIPYDDDGILPGYGRHSFEKIVDTILGDKSGNQQDVAAVSQPRRNVDSVGNEGASDVECSMPAGHDLLGIEAEVSCPLSGEFGRSLSVAMKKSPLVAKWWSPLVAK